MIKIEETNFKDHNIKERNHLQEWIANEPGCLDKDLLIIQKEFAGFDETYERLDLLALDKQGNLVIIENKLDDSGRDVTWQALKYVSYCSSLNSEQIIEIYDQYLLQSESEKDAKTMLDEFYETEDYQGILNQGNSQRIILVAHEFRKEVTSTVIWLIGNGLRIQCFKVTPYQLDEKLLLNFEQILPVSELAEYTISMATKSKDTFFQQEQINERKKIRRAFWVSFLEAIKNKTNLFDDKVPKDYETITINSKVIGIKYHCIIRKYECYSYVEIKLGSLDEKNNAFDNLLRKKDEIENRFGHHLEWEKLDEAPMSKIKYINKNFGYTHEDKWPDIIDFLGLGMVNMIKVFEPFVEELNFTN